MSKVSDFRKHAKKNADETPPPPVKAEVKQGTVPFNPREFHVPAINPKSKQPPDPMQFRAQQGHAHEVARIIAAKMFPYYETTSDLLRHGLYRHIEWLHSLGAPVTAEWLQVVAIVELTREEEYHQNFQNHLDRLHACVTKSVEMGMKSEARLLVQKIRLLVAQMSDGRWKERWVQEIQGRFGFLDDAPGAQQSTDGEQA